MSRLMEKPTICICENKDADQLRGNREADQRLCFRFTDSTIPLQANLIITLSLGSIETDSVISEPCYNEATFYRHIVN